MSELNFIWPAIWQELTNHAAVILLYFQKIKRLTFSFIKPLYILFLHHENARNVVQGNPKIIKFPGGACLRTPYKFVSSPLKRPPPPPTKNPGYTPAF